MKKNLLFAAMIAVGLMSNAQDANFDDAYPEGWIVNREIKLAKYDNPIKERLDTGMVTPAITGITGTTFFHMVTTSPAIYGVRTTDLRISFDAFPFKAGTRDFSGREDNRFSCSTSVKVFLVPEDYTSPEIPTDDKDIIAVSDAITVVKGNNVIRMDVEGDIVAGQSYRILVAASNNDCRGNAQAYVIDNVVVAEALFEENFDEGIFTGLGWNVLNGLTYSPYNTDAPGCGNDRGIVTPPITGEFTTWLVQTNANVLTSVSSESIKVRFDFFAFGATANFECAQAQTDLSCSTYVNVFVLDANNNSTSDRPSGTIYGESGFTMLVTGNNEITIPVTAQLEAGKEYRLLVVGKTENCPSRNAQRYVIDNVGVWSAIVDEDFAEVFPAGWDFNRELKITQYEANANNCDVNVGLTTAPIDGTFNNIYLMATPSTQYEPTTKIIRASFNLFAFDSDTRDYDCDDQEASIACPVTVRAYLVAGNYNSTSVPTGSQILGQSQPYQLIPNALNTFDITVNGTINPNLQYRVVVFGSANGCENNSDFDVLVLDNIRLLEFAGAILPVTFTHFTAKRNKSRVELTWETAMEENNRGFHVQRNIDGTWKNIGFVFSQANNGNSSEALSYSFNDVNNSRGITQYRLLQVDHDNKGKYSEVRAVRAEEQLAKIMVYPNPSSTGSVNVMFEDASALRDVYVTDVAGRVVKQYRNVNTNLLTIENLADGYYTIQITNRATAATTVEKVIIKKR